jgi:hypothetical protein
VRGYRSQQTGIPFEIEDNGIRPHMPMCGRSIRI